MKPINTTLLLTAMLLAVPLNSAMAADSTGKADPNIPDLSFNRYVDLAAMGVAWDNLDAALLTDTALQLAEGERILHRSHKSGITADEILKMAIKLATAEKDDETLDRLESVFKSRGDDKMVSAISNARKLSSQSRAVIPGYTVEDDVDPETMELYLDAKEEIRTAIATGELALVVFQLKELKDPDGPMSALTESQRAQLLKMLEVLHSPEGAEGSNKPSRVVVFLEDLKGTIRQWGGSPWGGSPYLNSNPWSHPQPWGPTQPTWGSHGNSVTHRNWQGNSRTVYDSARGPGARPITPIHRFQNGSERYIGADGQWHGKDVMRDANGNNHVRIFSVDE